MDSIAVCGREFTWCIPCECVAEFNDTVLDVRNSVYQFHFYTKRQQLPGDHQPVDFDGGVLVGIGNMVDDSTFGVCGSGWAGVVRLVGSGVLYDCDKT